MDPVTGLDTARPGGEPEPGDEPRSAADLDTSSTHPHWVRRISLFLGGQTASLFGSSLVQYAILWHLTLTTESGLVVTFATIAGFLPQAVVSVFAGVWADRYNRKLLVAGTDAVIAVTTLVLAILLLRGFDDLWLVYLVLAIRSVGAGIQTPAVSALIPQIVPTHQLMRVNGINSSIQSGSMLLSPAIAAWLYASFELAAVLFVDVVTAVIGITLVMAVPVARLVRTAEPVGYLDDLKAGWAYVRGHALVGRVLVFFAVIFVLIVPPSYLTPLMVVRSFGPEVWKLTATELAFSVGMILGGAFLAWWGGLKDRMSMLAGSSFVFGGLGILLGLSPTLWFFLAVMFLFGLALPFFWTTSQTLLQETVEPEFQGRVFGLQGIVMALAMPVGMLVVGPLSDVVSIESLLVVSGALTIVAALIIVTTGRTIRDPAAVSSA
jgi:DHA3 family macrolide efflux protein-like MFS transporter